MKTYFHIVSIDEGKEKNSLFQGDIDLAAFSHKTWFKLSDEVDISVHNISVCEVRCLSGHLPILTNQRGIVKCETHKQ